MKSKREWPMRRSCAFEMAARHVAVKLARIHVAKIAAGEITTGDEDNLPLAEVARRFYNQIKSDMKMRLDFYVDKADIDADRI